MGPHPIDQYARRLLTQGLLWHPLSGKS